MKDSARKKTLFFYLALIEVVSKYFYPLVLAVSFVYDFFRIFITIFATLRNERLKRKFRGCGKGVFLHGPINISGASNISVGNNVHLGANAYIRGEGGLRLGSNIHVSRNLTVYTINHNYEGECLPYDHEMIAKPVVIEDNVWIGVDVVICPGVTVGEGAIIGMGCVVSSDVPPLSIVGGQKQRVLKYRDKNHYEKLKAESLFGFASGFR
jgi:acetyltransferase-like isoleucine patch superfamily enzyme